MLGSLLKGDPAPSIPPGTRLYAFGDVHGRADLLDRLLDNVAEDNRTRDDAETHLVFLGDLIDRGPDSRAVVERAISLSKDNANVHFLKGNHEEIFLRVVNGDANAMRLFSKVGGLATLSSYGINADDFVYGNKQELVNCFNHHLPIEHRYFLNSLPETFEFGDYLFVHAGVRPEIELRKQIAEDLLWIRSDFLDFEGKLDKVIVHGHSVAQDIQERPHRIGIDTGAFRTGVLTCLGLEGSDHWFLQTEGRPSLVQEQPMLSEHSRSPKGTQ